MAKKDSNRSDKATQLRQTARSLRSYWLWAYAEGFESAAAEMRLLSSMLLNCAKYPEKFNWDEFSGLLQQIQSAIDQGMPKYGRRHDMESRRVEEVRSRMPTIKVMASLRRQLEWDARFWAN